jgi:hypothetical protein
MCSHAAKPSCATRSRTLFLAQPLPKPDEGRAFLHPESTPLFFPVPPTPYLTQCQNSGSKPLGEPSPTLLSPCVSAFMPRNCVAVCGRTNVATVECHRPVHVRAHARTIPRPCLDHLVVAAPTAARCRFDLVIAAGWLLPSSSAS